MTLRSKIARNNLKCNVNVKSISNHLSDSDLHRLGAKIASRCTRCSVRGDRNESRRCITPNKSYSPSFAAGRTQSFLCAFQSPR